MATPHKAGCTPVEPPALPAVVVALPGAAEAPVVQTRRVGRLPKAVVTLWKARQARSAVVRIFELRAQLKYVRQAWAENFAEFRRDSDALIKLKKRMSATEAVYEELTRRDAELTAALSALGDRVPAFVPYATGNAGDHA